MKLRLVCAFVVRKQRSQGFLHRGTYEVEAGLRLCCSQATKSGVFCIEAHMKLRLVCAFVVRKKRSQGFFASRHI